MYISENVSKLKKLEYLNLALNNIEKIENLEGKNFLLIFYYEYITTKFKQYHLNKRYTFQINTLPETYVLIIMIKNSNNKEVHIFQNRKSTSPPS